MLLMRMDQSCDTMPKKISLDSFIPSQSEWQIPMSDGGPNWLEILNGQIVSIFDSQSTPIGHFFWVITYAHKNLHWYFRSCKQNWLIEMWVVL